MTGNGTIATDHTLNYKMSAVRDRQLRALARSKPSWLPSAARRRRNSIYNSWNHVESVFTPTER